MRSELGAVRASLAEEEPLEDLVPAANARAPRIAPETVIEPGISRLQHSGRLVLHRFPCTGSGLPCDPHLVAGARAKVAAKEPCRGPVGAVDVVRRGLEGRERGRRLCERQAWNDAELHALAVLRLVAVVADVIAKPELEQRPTAEALRACPDQDHGALAGPHTKPIHGLELPAAAERRPIPHRADSAMAASRADGGVAQLEAAGARAIRRLHSLEDRLVLARVPRHCQPDHEELACFDRRRRPRLAVARFAERAT